MRWCVLCQVHRMADCRGSGCAAIISDRHSEHAKVCDCAEQEKPCPTS